MALKLYKRGRIWWMGGTVIGQTIRRSTRTDQLQYAEVIRVQTESRLLEEAVFGKRAVVTFREAAESYKGSHRYLVPLIDRLGEKRLHSIAQADLDRLAVSLHPGSSSETLNRQVYTPFIAVWNHAARSGWADPRQWQRPRKPKGTNVRRSVQRAGARPASYDRAALFVSHMSPAAAMVMTALFYTGMRPIELFSLKVEDVSIVGRWIVLSSTKTGEPRGVPLHEFLVPIFASLATRGGILFRTHKGEPYPTGRNGDPVGGQLKSAINGARCRAARAGSPITDVSPYTARHTVSTQLVINGVHPYIKDQILGHASDRMSRHYTNVPQRPLIDAINTLPVPENWPRWADPLAASRELVKWGEKS